MGNFSAVALRFARFTRFALRKTALLDFASLGQAFRVRFTATSFALATSGLRSFHSLRPTQNPQKKGLPILEIA